MYQIEIFGYWYIQYLFSNNGMVKNGWEKDTFILSLLFFNCIFFTKIGNSLLIFFWQIKNEIIEKYSNCIFCFEPRKIYSGVFYLKGNIIKKKIKYRKYRIVESFNTIEINTLIFSTYEQDPRIRLVDRPRGGSLWINWYREKGSFSPWKILSKNGSIWLMIHRVIQGSGA